MKIGQYFKDCVQELNKVCWPKKKEVAVSVRVVLISTLLSALVLWVVDFVVLRVFSFFIW